MDRRFRYIVSTDTDVNYYDFTISMLQGIYSYVTLINLAQYETKSPIHKFKAKLKDTNIIAESEWVDPNVQSSYNNPIYNVLNYKMSDIDLRDHPFASDVSLIRNQPGVLHLFVAKEGTIDSTSLTISIVTSNLSEYLAGVLFLDRLLTRDVSSTTFGIFMSPNITDFIIFNALSGFPLMNLPNELVNQITSYYPCDWTQVSKDLYHLVNPKILSDPRVSAKTKWNIAENILKQDIINDTDIEKLVEYARHIPLIELSHAPDINSFILHLSPSGNPSLIRVMDALTNRIISLYSLDRLINFFRWDRNAEYANYIIDNYSDDIYFSDIKIETKQPMIFTKLLLNRFILPSSISFTDLSSINNISDNDLLAITREIVSNRGVFTKSDINPLTGTRRIGYQEKSVTIDLVEYIASLVTYLSSSKYSFQSGFGINMDHYPRTVRQLYANLDFVPDAPYYDKLALLLRQTIVSADITFFETALVGLLNSKYITLNTLRTYTDKYFPETGITKYGYTDDYVKELITRIKAHPNYVEV